MVIDQFLVVIYFVVVSRIVYCSFMMSAPKSVPLRKVTRKATTVTGEQFRRFCVVHYERCKDSKIRPLSEKAFAKIHAEKETRTMSSDPVHQLALISDKIPDELDGNRHGVHIFCYKSYVNTAHIKVALQRQCSANAMTFVRSPHKIRKRTPASSCSVNSTESRILFPRKRCLFCDRGPTKKRGRYVGLTRCEAPQAAKKILEMAVQKNDCDLLLKIRDQDLVAREAHYHDPCRNSYVSDKDRSHHRSKLAEQPEQPDSDDELYVIGSVEHRRAYNAAFGHLCVYIEDHIIGNGNAVRMSTLREMYLDYIQENTPNYFNPEHKIQKLKARITRHFVDRINFWQPRKGSELIFSAEISVGEAVAAAFEFASSESQILHDAAMLLHRHILQQQSASADMPWPPSVAFLTSSAVSPPVTLLDFVTRVIAGKSSSAPNDSTVRVASSLAEDLCSAASNGRWKMPKHLLLGTALHQITGSAKVVTLISRSGHCSSYAQVLDLENAMEIQTKLSDPVLPNNISVLGNKLLQSCFDNFDLLEETASGADTYTRRMESLFKKFYQTAYQQQWKQVFRKPKRR